LQLVTKVAKIKLEIKKAIAPFRQEYAIAFKKKILFKEYDDTKSGF
jgi:hypothetical protein